MEKRDYSTILFTPEQIGLKGNAYLKAHRENKGLGVPFGLDDFDKEDPQGNILLPVMPGEVVSIIARPGHGKTGSMVRWARYRAQWLRTQNIKNRVVLYISLEQTIEELNAFNLAADKKISITKMAAGEITDAEWNQCLEESITRRFMPLWNIGYSATTDQKQIRIDADAIRGAIELIHDQHKLEIDCCFVDYLQRMPYDRAETKVVGVSDNLDALKTIAQQTAKAAMVVGVQAQREVDDMKPPIPGLGDGQWTSNIEQTSDKVLSLVRPILYDKEGETFGKIVIEGHCQQLISVLKQKLGPANWCKWVYFDPIYNKLENLDKKRADDDPNSFAKGKRK